MHFSKYTIKKILIILSIIMSLLLLACDQNVSNDGDIKEAEETKLDNIVIDETVEDEEILVTKSALIKYLNSDVTLSGIHIKSANMNKIFKNNQIIEVVAIGDIVTVDETHLTQLVSIKVGMNVIEARTEATVFLTKTLQKDWVVSGLEINQALTTFSSPRELIGRWGEYFRFNNQDFFGVLIINDYNEDELIYKGKFMQSKCADWPTGDMSPVGTYDIELTYDLEDDLINMHVTKVIKESDDFPGIELTMQFDENMSLVCEPTNWEKQSTAMFVFDQQSDTYDYD